MLIHPYNEGVIAGALKLLGDAKIKQKNHGPLENR